MNCQNYVETVLARAVSSNPQDVDHNAIAIRYSHLPADYYTRNHFPAADWIPNNIHKHYINYSPLNTSIITKFENKQAWCVTQLHNKKLCDEKFKNTWAHLRYIPIKKLPDVAAEIPGGSIIFIVKPTKYTLISHMGFAIQKDHELYLRAASSLAGKVTDYNLMDYLKFEPNTLGISVLVPEEQRQQPTKT
ncbi:MAG TPA: N-acetylmuramoyl-L-alanine amidase-like domain-containing protein [Gammaproteobacteria bacterium]|nr:N-acetylmuramoyl-L-alanine amidase-like domain-containing protein [Gammaproteobacteria bacterium]